MAKHTSIVLLGSNGQLGSDIVKVFSQDTSYKLIPLTHTDIDVTNYSQVQKVMQDINPAYVINTTAYHKVDEVEENSDKAFLVNASAQKNLAELSQKNDWTLVYISTDYVFGLDAKRSTPYKEIDPTNPVNTYGVAKVAGENFTRYINKKHIIIRSSGLFGSAGASGKGGNFVELMIKLGKEKKEVSVVNDQVLTPTYTKNIAQNLKVLLTSGEYGTYHMTSQGQCSWWEFAKEIFHSLHMQVACNAVSSDFFHTRALRPSYSVLENHNLQKLHIDIMKDWRINLREYLQEKGYL